jgi:predicted ATP-dependent endonuclease of OLD family
MKIKNIYIPKLHHFNDLHLDLTYPLGHPKAGEALDKICIIGQSGTGKTTLLKLISILSYRPNNYSSITDLDTISKIEVELQLDDLRIQKRIEMDEESEKMSNIWTEGFINEAEVSFDDGVKIWNEFLKNSKTLSIYFPADLDFKLEVDQNDKTTLDKQKVIDFSIERVADIWKIILSDIQNYQENEIKIRQEISKVAENSKDIDAIQEAVKKLEDWRSKRYNPVEDVAEKCLDPLLKNFGLRVKTALDFQGKDDIGFIKIEDFEGNEVPNGLLSTGTKQVMLSALPLFLLKPHKSQILYDEPERSLYPDMQRIIVDYYIKQTVDCQFFFCTHSPIIASSFEPWEIVELKFDDNWNIYRDKYFEGENHVDNYFVDPRYLDFDLILSKIFDLKDTNTDLRTEAIVEVTMLKNQLNELKSQHKLKTAAAGDLIKRYKNLAKKLAWNIE